MDLASDPRFQLLPEWAQEELKKHKPTGDDMGGVTWHETQFEMGGIMCQCAVLDGKYVPRGIGSEQFSRIIKVWKKEEVS